MHAMTMKRRVTHWIYHNLHFFIFGWVCIIWFLFRTGTKPSRIVYPCQQASIAGANLWFAAYLLPLVSLIRTRGNGRGLVPIYLGGGIIMTAIHYRCPVSSWWSESGSFPRRALAIQCHFRYIRGERDIGE